MILSGRKRMKIIFMGTPDLAAGVLNTMMENGCDVCLAVSQPDRPRGRGKSLSKTPVHECADKWGIPVFSPRKVKDPSAVERLRQENADLIVVAAFGQILSQEILDLPRYGCVNVHASLLPKYRGAAPIQWAVINGETETGVTIMQMNAGLDTGDILLQERVPLDAAETGESLYEKLTAVGGELIMKALPMIEAGTIKPVKQDDRLSSYAPMLNREMGNIDWTMQAAQIERLVRGLNSWPSAYTFYGGRMLKIWNSEPAGDEAFFDEKPSGLSGETHNEPGTVISVDKTKIYVQCGEGVLALLEVQMEGKKRMSVQTFLLGTHIKSGEKFERSR